MNAWGKSGNVGDKILMLADGNGEYVEGARPRTECHRFRHGHARTALRHHRQERRGDPRECRSAGRVQGVGGGLRAEAALAAPRCSPFGPRRRYSRPLKPSALRARPMALRWRRERSPASAIPTSICAPPTAAATCSRSSISGRGPRRWNCQLRVLRHWPSKTHDPGTACLRHAQGEETGKAGGREGTYSTCLMHFLAGRLLADSPPGARLLTNLGQTLARLDRALQGFFHPALGQRLAWDVRRLPELAEYLPCVESAAARCAASERRPARPGTHA